MIRIENYLLRLVDRPVVGSAIVSAVEALTDPVGFSLDCFGDFSSSFAASLTAVPSLDVSEALTEMRGI